MTRVSTSDHNSIDPKTVIARRMGLARASSALSLRDLGTRVGLSHNAISKFEKGLATPSGANLVAIAAALDRPLDFFVRPFGPEIGEISFRKKSSLGAREEKAIRARIRDRIERYVQLEELLDAHVTFQAPLRPDVEDGEDAEAWAAALREAWRLGSGPLPNILEILEERGVRVLQTDAPERFNGCSGFAGAVPFAVLADWLDRDLPRKRFTALHELGHLLMKPAKEVDAKLEEKLCHRFASAFLVPEEAVYETFGRQRSQVNLDEVILLKKEYGISLAASFRRLADLKVISAESFRVWMIRFSKQGFRRPGAEPGVYVGEERAFRFDQLLARAVGEERITLSKAAALSGQSLESLRPQQLEA